MLINGLDTRLTSIFRCNYKDYAQLHGLQALYQRSKFPTILLAMQMSEDKVQSITAIACSSVCGQAFYANALAFLSQAESTLNCYSGGYCSDGRSCIVPMALMTQDWALARMTAALVARALTLG
jgi:hypothetical protein